MRTWNKIKVESELITVDKVMVDDIEQERTAVAKTLVAEVSQEIVDGVVERYVDTSGVEVYDVLPLGLASEVTEADSNPPKAVRDAGAVRDADAVAARPANTWETDARRALNELLVMTRELAGPGITRALEARLDELGRLLA